MNVHITYKSSKAPDVEREFQHQIEKLQRRLQVFRPELVHLHGIVEAGAAKGEISVSLNLRLPSGQLAAQKSGSTAVAASKGAFADLVSQVTRHKELLRGQHRRARRGNGRTVEVPFEETLAAVHPARASGADVNSFINANLQRLERYIERDLRYRINSGQISPDAISRDEVLDEVVAAALGDEEKPQLLSLERWMYGMAMRTMGRMSRTQEPYSPVRLEESARKPNVRASDEPQLQFHQPDETMLEEEVIADRRVATPEQIASSDEMIALVEESLLNAPQHDREAFVLYAVEGFTLNEIAAITDRNSEQVRESIHAAREHLKQTLHVPDPFRQTPLPRPKIA
jgi:RNA polymerase sigma factor (sigma-70 family)